MNCAAACRIMATSKEDLADQEVREVALAVASVAGREEAGSVDPAVCV